MHSNAGNASFLHSSNQTGTLTLLTLFLIKLQKLQFSITFQLPPTYTCLSIDFFVTVLTTDRHYLHLFYLCTLSLYVNYWFFTVHLWFRLRFDFPHGEFRVLPVGIERGGGIRLFKGNWNRGRRGGCIVQNSTIVIYVRTLFMLRHSVNIVKTGENVPKFYNLCSIPIFTLFSRNKNMFKLTPRRSMPRLFIQLDSFIGFQRLVMILLASGPKVLSIHLIQSIPINYMTCWSFQYEIDTGPQT
jgi:hypothetical protein